MLIFIAPKSYAVQGQGSGGSAVYGDGTYDYYFPSVAVLLHGEGSNAGTVITDEAGGSVVATSMTTSTIQKKFGASSMYFPGSLASHADFAAAVTYALGTSDFTIECWIYLSSAGGGPAATSNALQAICDGRTAAAAQAFAWVIPYGGGSLVWYDGPNNLSYTDKYQFVPGTWYHIAVCRSGTVLSQYVNGVCIGSHAGLGTNYGSSQPLRIGSSQATGDNYGFFGYIDEFRITKRARYTNTFNLTQAFDNTDSWYPNVASLMHFNGANGSTTFTDSAATPLTWTVASGTPTLSTAQAVFGGSSLRLNGSSALQSTAYSNAGSGIGTGDFTIEAWAFFDTIPGSGAYACVFDGVTSNMLTLFLYGPSTVQVYLSSTLHTFALPTPFVAGTWYHIALTRQSGTLRLFLNGVQPAIGQASAESIAIQGIRLGSQFNSTIYMTGYIDEFRFTPFVARYSSSFTLPIVNQFVATLAAPFDNTDRYWNNVGLLLHMDGSDASTTFTDAKGINNVTPKLGAALSVTQSKFGTSSFLSDNTSHKFLQIASSPIFDFSASDFTIEMWVYPTANSQGGLFGKRTNDAGVYSPIMLVLLVGTAGPQLQVNISTSGSAWAASVTVAKDLVLNTWHHIAVSRSGANLYAYVDGVPYLITNAVGTLFSNTTDITIGSTCTLASGWTYPTQAGFNGYIDEVRITKGFGRYSTVVSALGSVNNDLTDTLNNATLFDMAITGIDGQDNSWISDSSPNNVLLYRAGTVGQGASNPYEVNWSVYFNGSSYVKGPQSTALSFGTGDFTIEAWVNLGAIPAINATYRLVGVGSSADGANNLWAFGIFTNGATSNQYFDFAVWNGSSYVNYNPGLTNPFTLSTNTWYHVAVVRQGAVLSFYLNGVLKGTAAATFTANCGLSGMTIGCRYNTSSAAPIEYTTGTLSSLRIVKGTAVYTTSFTPPTAPLTAISGTALLTCQNNRFIDNSTNAWSLVPVGTPMARFTSPWAQTTNYQPVVPNNTALYFGGASRLTAAGINGYITTGPFTIEFWVRPTYSAFPSETVLVSNYFWVTGNTGGWLINSTATGALVLGASTGVWNSRTAILTTPASSIALNVWSHVALTRDSSNVLRFFVNGVQVASVTYAPSLALIGTQNTTYWGGTLLGGYVEDSTFYSPLTGYLSNVRINNTSAIYTSAFTAPTQPLTAVPGTVFLAGVPGTTTTTDGVLNALTLTGAVPMTSCNFGALTGSASSGSLVFNGTTDYLTMTQSVGQFGTSDFTIECWVYPIAHTQNTPIIFSNYTTWTTGSLGLIAGHNASSTTKYQVVVNGGTYPSAANNLQSTSSIIYGAWTHLAVVRSGNTLTLYINGVADGTLSVAGMTLSGNGASCCVGAGLDSTAAEYFNGQICDLRVVRGTALYTSNFTPSLVAFDNTDPQYSAVKALLHFEGADNGTTFTDDIGHVVSVNAGTPVTSTAQANIGSSSLYLNGSSRLSLPASSDWDFSAGTFTVEGWFYPTALPGSGNVCRTILIGVNGQSSCFTVFQIDSTGAILCNVPASAAIGGPAGTVVVNTWQHFAVSVLSGVARFFKNGILIGGPTAIPMPTSASNVLYIGYDTVATVNAPYTGYIDELRITNGVARYLQAFIPNSAPLTSVAGTSLLLQGSNSVVYDNTKKSNLMTYNTNVATVPSRSGRCLYFNGTSSSVSTVSPIPSLGTGDFSMECWFNHSTFATAQMLMSQWTNTSSYVVGHFQFYTDTTGKPVFTVATGASTYNTYTSSVAAPLNQWNHVAVIRQSGVLSIWLNGVTTYSAASVEAVCADGYSLDIGYEKQPGYADPFNGYIEGVRVTRASRSLSSMWAYDNKLLSGITSPSTAFGDHLSTEYYYDQTISAWDFESLNATVGNYPLTLVGTGALSSVQKKYGTQSLYCAGGANNGASFSLDSILKDVNGDWTIECWAYTTSVNGGYNNLIMAMSTGSAPNTKFYFGENTSSVPYFYIYNSVGTGITATGSSAITLSTWHHWALVRNGLSISLYVDGIRVGTTTFTGPLYLTTTTVGTLGYYPDGVSNWKGYIDDVRFTNYARYVGSSVTVPGTTLTTALRGAPGTYDPYWWATSLLMHLENNVTDSTGLNTVTNNGVTFSNSTVKVGTYSAAFSNSAAQYLQSSNVGVLPTTQDFTIEFWLYILPGTTSSSVFATRTSGNTGILLTWVSGNLNLNLGNGSWFLSMSQSDATFSTGAWHHVAVSRAGANAYIFMDGLLKASTAAATGSITNQTLVIGYDLGNPIVLARMNGYIDELRVTNGVGRYVSAFTPPATAFVTTAGTAPTIDPYWKYTQLLMHMEGANNGTTFTNSALNALTPTMIGAPVTSTSQFKVGGSSLQVNGSSGLAYAPNITGLQFASNDFTVEAYIYPTLSQSGQIIGIQKNGVSSDWLLYLNAGKIAFHWNNSSDLTAVSSVALNSWSHVAAVRYGTNLLLFVNGQIMATATISVAISASTGWNCSIGCDTIGALGFNGYIDELRITNGVARYTGNFIPPTYVLPAANV